MVPKWLLVNENLNKALHIDREPGAPLFHCLASDGIGVFLRL